MKRLPDKQEIINSFLTILTVVNFWAVLIYLYNFPGLIKRLTITDSLSVLSYVLFSALFESLAILLVLVFLSVLLPAKLLRTNFSPRIALILLLSVIYIIPFHINIPKLSYLNFEPGITLFIAFWTLLYIIELVIFHQIINKYPHITSRIATIVERVTMLGAIYLFIDLVSLGFVIIANWS
jgi:hypothetical protein